MQNIQAFIRVKRRLDDSHLTGIRVAKRQKLEGDEADTPLELSYAGTAEQADVESAISVIRSHFTEAQRNKKPFTVADLPPNPNEPPYVSSSLLSEDDIDELFKIYDTYQEKISLTDSKGKDNSTNDREKSKPADKFVYDIYYVKDPDNSRGLLDYDDEKYKIEGWLPDQEVLVDTEKYRDSDNEQYEDEDSNAEDNPNNDYPDDEEWYGDRGEERQPYFHDDDDYYGYEQFDHLSYLEERLLDMNLREEQEDY